MDKKEIEKLIEQEKKTIAEFQKLVIQHKLSEEYAQQQINFYLGTINDLKKLLEKLKD